MPGGGPRKGALRVPELKRLLAAVAAVALFMASEAEAQSILDSIARQLREQGYSRIEVSQTWLGRVRFVARGNGLRREIVVNPATGEILRDYWEPLSRGEDGGGRLFDPGGSASAGDDDDRDDDDDDRDDDDDDDDDGGDDDGGDDDGGGDDGGGDDDD